jgi:hypothetical protein
MYNYRGGMLASFSSSAVAICLYLLVIFWRYTIWTFWSGLRRNLGGPFSVSPIAQMLDLYVIIGQMTAEYNRRDLWKHRLYIELIILNIAINCI